MLGAISLVIVLLISISEQFAYNLSLSSQYTCGDPRWALKTNDSNWNINITIWTLSNVFLRPGFIKDDLCVDCKTRRIEPWFFINVSVAIPINVSNHTRFLDEMYESAMKCTKFANGTEPVFFNFPCSAAPHWHW